MTSGCITVTTPFSFAAAAASARTRRRRWQERCCPAAHWRRHVAGCGPALRSERRDPGENVRVFFVAAGLLLLLLPGARAAETPSSSRTSDNTHRTPIRGSASSASYQAAYDSSLPTRERSKQPHDGNTHTPTEEPHIELVTVTNDANRAWRLLQTASLPVRVLGPLGNESFVDYLRDAYLLRYVRDLIRRGRSNTIVILLDAWDVIWLGCRRNLTQAFLALRRPLFFSAEFGFYPWGSAGVTRLEEASGEGYPTLTDAYSTYDHLPRCRGGRDPLSACRPQVDVTAAECSFCAPETSGGGYRFLNNGCYGGYAWALERALSRIYASGQWRDHPFARDLHWRGRIDLSQASWHAYVMDEANREEVALDYGASICMNLHGMGGSIAPRHSLRDRSSFDFEVRDGRVFSRAFGKDVCFVHANGGMDKNILDKFMAAGPRLPLTERVGASEAARLRIGRGPFSADVT